MLLILSIVIITPRITSLTIGAFIPIGEFGVVAAIVVNTVVSISNATLYIMAVVLADVVVLATVVVTTSTFVRHRISRMVGDDTLD